MNLADVLAPELALLNETDRLRATPILDGKGTTRRLGDSSLLVFASNDYLGLAAHPAVAAAAAHAAATWGTGSSGARLVTGAFPLQDRLEREVAQFLGLEAALLFPSGYQANVGLMTALAGPSDLIVSDALNHASIIDGCRLSKAAVRVYRHADADHAATLLGAAGIWRRKFLVTESLFSMDGDHAPLARLAEAAARHDAHFLVDEAHAVGTQGSRGQGRCAAEGIVPAALTATLGKSLGAGGAFVAGTDVLRSYLVNRARAFVFTTAPPPQVLPQRWRPWES